MASSGPTKRRKKSAKPNLDNAAATTFYSQAQLAIETIAYKDEEFIYLYIDAQIGKQKLNKTLVNFDNVVERISQKVVSKSLSSLYR